MNQRKVLATQMSQQNLRGILRWLCELLSCETGKEVSPDSLVSCKLLGLYFSASWCPPCQHFVPILAKGYQQIREQYGAQSFEVVLVPLDSEEANWNTFISKMPWLTIPLSQREAIVRLFTHFEISEAPRLIVIDPSSAEVISDNARGVGGFGFGCDPIAAYERLLEDLDKKRRSARTVKAA
ncbi:unnamed protein product [Polarella glacialis]|uniref:Thioredoxin domain-containing protein n=1 Tax=Polarella glacialis TaxID=89957 RepID=A0A813LHR5_POLGL|nr:unnamed protein product [Polarella glacialis]